MTSLEVLSHKHPHIYTQRRKEQWLVSDKYRPASHPLCPAKNRNRCQPRSPLKQRKKEEISSCQRKTRLKSPSKTLSWFWGITVACFVCSGHTDESRSRETRKDTKTVSSPNKSSTTPWREILYLPSNQSVFISYTKNVGFGVWPSSEHVCGEWAAPESKISNVSML